MPNDERTGEKPKRSGFSAIPGSLLKSFAIMSPFFNTKILSLNAQEDAIDSKARYWIENFFLKYGLVIADETQNVKKRKYYLQKQVETTSKWLESIVHEIDDPEKNQKYDKLFLPIQIINRYNSIGIKFTINDLKDNLEFSLVKLYYWLQFLEENKVIKELGSRRPKKYEKQYGILFSDWIKGHLIKKVKDLEE